MSRLIKLYLYFLTCLLIIQLPSSGNNLTFRKYQVNNGLSENTVQTILQDKQGFLWFGTKDGLNRFDGKEYRIFRNNPRNPGSIGNNFIRSIYEDTDGRLWIGTDNKIFIYNPITENFTPFEMKTEGGISINSAVTAICAENENTIWIGTMTQGAFCYTKDLIKLKQFNVNDDFNSLHSNLVWRIYKDLSETIWIGTRGGLSRFNRETRNFQKYRPSNNFNFTGDNEILSIHEDADGDLWLGTWSGGLFKMDKQSQTFTSFFGNNNTPYVTKIRAINEYEKNRLLIGSDDGLFLMEKSTGAVQRVDDPGNPSSLSDQNVYSIYNDREGGIWIGTYFGGVNYLSVNRNTIEHYYSGYSDSYLSGKAVSQFCEDEKGNLWIATEDGGLNYFDVKKKQFRKILPQRTGNGLSYHNLHSLVLDGDHLWIGTFSSGIDVLNIKTNTFKNYRFENNKNSIDDNCVFSLYKNKNSDIYVGTPFGLSKYNRLKNHFERIAEVRGFVYDMQEDSHGLFWVTTYGDGVFQYNPTSNQWKNYVHIEKSTNSLNFNKVIDVFVDDKQRLWFTTEGRGICKYNYETDDFTTIDETKGLPNNVAYGILDDKYGNIWVSTNMGITRINPETLEMKTYTKEDGLQSNQFNYRSSYKSRGGVFYFGGINGFNAFHPDNLKDNNYVPPVIISAFELLDEDNQYEPDSLLKTAINRDKKITLKYNQASFKIGFISMSFQAVEKNRYSCIMEGLEDKWRSVGNQNSLIFSNLKPGEYTFRVKGSNNDGIWNETGDYLHIEILPPFWKSNVALMIYGFLFISGLFLVIQTIVSNSQKRHKQKIEEIKIEKEKELYDSKISFFTNIAHEIRTPVSLIKAPLENIVNSQQCTPEAKENLYIIERNTEKLLVLVNQLLDFRKIEENQYRMSLVQTNVNDFLNDIFLSFKATGIRNNIALNLFLPSKPLIANIDKDALNKVINNLLSNALKFARQQIEIYLSEDKKAEMMEIRIVDDGPGIEAELREKVFEPFFQIMNKESFSKNNGTGIGLSLARQLVDRLSGKIFISDDGANLCSFIVQIPTNLPVSHEEVIINDEPAATIKSVHQIHHHPDKMYLLVVEDNEELQNFIEKNLKNDFNVLVANNGEEALKILDESVIDLVLSDIVMPGIDGLELTRLIKHNEQYSHIPVILLSAKTNISTKIEGLEHGADIYIEKPFSLVYLKAQISSLIENRMRVLDKFSKSPFISYGTIANNKRDEEFIQRINAEIEKNILDIDFSIEKLANNLSMSRSNLQRKIKGISGLAPNDYIRVYRLKKAADLLIKEDYRINEICYIVGFNSGSYFAKCFQKQFGVLPKDFVKSGDHEIKASHEN